ALGKDLGEGLLIRVVKVFFQIHRAAVLQGKGIVGKGEYLVVRVGVDGTEVNGVPAADLKVGAGQNQGLGVRVDPRYVDGVPTADLKVGAGQNQGLGVRVDPRYVDGVPTADGKVGAGKRQLLLI